MGLSAPETMIAVIVLLVFNVFFSFFGQVFKTVKKPRLQKEAGGYLIASRFWVNACRIPAVILAGMYLERFAEAQPTEAVVTVTLVLIVLFISGLIPKIIAPYVPERIAAASLPLFNVFMLPLRPFLFLVRIAEERLRLTFPRQQGQSGMTEDELRLALMEGEKSGIVESKERTMVEGVFYLGDRPLGAFMTHRSDIQWLDIHAPIEDIRAKVLEYRQQRCFPVADGALDAIIGAAYLEDIILDLASGQAAGLRTVMKKAIFAPETMPALKAFESFRRGKANYLFAMDEYGGFAGMVCMQDLMEEIVGELTAPVREEERVAPQEDGSWLAGGGLNIDDAAAIFSLPGLAASDDYHTLAGFVLSLAEELPRAGDSFMYQDCRFTVLDMDGNRINKIMIKKESETVLENR